MTDTETTVAPATYPPPEREMTRAEWGSLGYGEFIDRLWLVRSDGPPTAWYRGLNNGLTPDRNQAVPWSDSAIRGLNSRADENLVLELLPEGRKQPEIDANGNLELDSTLPGLRSAIAKFPGRQWTIEDMEYLRPNERYWSLGSYGPAQSTPVAHNTERILQEPWFRDTPQSRRVLVRLIALPREGQKCQVEAVLPEALIKLVRLAPENEVVRTQVHAKILVPLPPEAKTWEAIQRWIEDNISFADIMKAEEEQAVRQPRTTPTPQAEASLSISVSATDVESGSCHYSVTRTGEDYYVFSLREVQELVDEDCRTFDEVVNALIAQAVDLAQENPPEMGWDNDTLDHDRYDSEDTEDLSIDTPRRSTVADTLRGFLATRDPQLLARLNAAQEEQNQ